MTVSVNERVFFRNNETLDIYELKTDGKKVF